VGSSSGTPGVGDWLGAEAGVESRVAGSRAGSCVARASAPIDSKFWVMAPRLNTPGREWP
jgi:hypothetical protein